MMLQFEAFKLDGAYCLFIVDTTRYDWMIGLRRFIKRLD